MVEECWPRISWPVAWRFGQVTNRALV